MRHQKAEVFQYLRTAPHTPEHARARVVLAAGYFGGLRCDDIVKLGWKDTRVVAGEGVWISLYDRRTGLVQDGHEFLASASVEDTRVCAVQIFEEYRSMLKHPDAGRVVMTIRNNRFTDGPLGKNQLRAIPKFIATFLELENPRR